MEENQIIEWKENWRDEYLKWICGFANAQGGTLFIGKNDQGETIGLSNAKALLEEIPNKIKDILGIVADVDLKNEKGKEFIEIHVDACPFPVNYKGQYHYRSGSTKQELTGNALNTFLLKKYGLHWDAIPLTHLSVDMLESEAFKLFTKKAVKSKRLGDEVLTESQESILRKLLLFEGSQLKKATALLFYEEPEQFVTGAFIKIGFFRTNADLIYQDEIHGNLFLQVDKALDLLLTKYMKAYISYEGLQRIETYLFPAPALREALLNAVIHKDYSSGNPIQISVYENKIMFWNAGQLPVNFTIDTLFKKHPSIPYNPLIASAFFRAGYIEAWGRGIEKITNECRLANVPLPEFDYQFPGLMVIFDAGDISHLEEASTKTTYKVRRKASEKNVGEMSEKNVGEISEKILDKASKKILDLIEMDMFITIAELAKKTNLTSRSIERHLKQLQIQNRLQRIGPDRGGYWKVV